MAAIRAAVSKLPSAALREDTRPEVALEHYNRQLQGDTRRRVASPRHTATHRSDPRRVSLPRAKAVEDILVQDTQARDLVQLDMHPPPPDRSLPSLRQVRPSVPVHQEFPKQELLEQALLKNLLEVRSPFY